MHAKSKGSLLHASLANKSVVDRVVEQITNAIIAGELRPGDRIPTELELSESFEVGRNSVREAVKVLESFGVLRIRRSEGTFVAEGFNKQMLDPMLYGLILQKDAAVEIMELRQVFDTGIIQLVSDHATPQDLTLFRNALAELEGVASDIRATPEQVLEADVAFHAAIIGAMKNPLLAGVAGYIDRITIPSRVRTMRTILNCGLREGFISLHTRIVEVIEQREPSSIAETVKDHYQFWKQETTGGLQ